MGLHTHYQKQKVIIVYTEIIIICHTGNYHVLSLPLIPEEQGLREWLAVNPAIPIDVPIIELDSLQYDECY